MPPTLGRAGGIRMEEHMTPSQERALADKLDGWWCTGQLDLLEPLDFQPTASRSLTYTP